MKEDPMPQTFAAFGFNEHVTKGIKKAGFKEPSPIQLRAIPAVMEGRDVIAQAHTGTGKTAAFGLPALNGLKFNNKIELLIIAPTRELASQVSDEIHRLGRDTGARTGTVYGGQAYGRQVQMLKRGISVLSATPGRLLDLLKSRKLKGLTPSIVVLDEADEMLDMGFYEDIQAIFDFLPQERQTLLFSATMPPAIRTLATELLNDPVHIKTGDKKQSTNSDVQQNYYTIREGERDVAVIRLLETQAPGKAIVFCRTRSEVDRVYDTLSARGFSAAPIHGDIPQAKRNAVMQRFRNGRFDVLVATDVAARGLDVPDISHVFNYHMPFDSKSYVHRVGRTGRAGRKGTAITLVTPAEYRQMQRIQKRVGATIQQRTIPSLEELRSQRKDDLAGELHNVKVSKPASDLVEALAEQMAPAEAAKRLATLLLSQEKENGPEQIGLNKSQVEKLAKKGPSKPRRANYRHKRKGPPKRHYNARRQKKNAHPPKRASKQ